MTMHSTNQCIIIQFENDWSEMCDGNNKKQAKHEQSGASEKSSEQNKKRLTLNMICERWTKKKSRQIK